MSSKMRRAKVALPQKRAKGDASQAFDQKQIQEFKEAFTIMDSNKDGVIDKNDLKNTYASLGQVQGDSVLDAMLKEASGPLNFGTFLSLFGERLTGTDPDETIAAAFQLFDHLNTGFMSEDQLIKTLKNPTGEPLTEEEIKAMYKGNPPISGGKVDVQAFIKMITTGGQDELAKANA